ncbi:hypothetical protein UFOVP523_13 [uncultured Caudovirales phage]|uniref:Uncharacterized protein n=1 Tax=uncultured Caudovirales phage TaxID=2100421 RepID=A0A6J5MU02_9CAUD|nr:hypothetical protein UFOVP523_13 [uncultured Caudovirales phage]
MKRQVDIYIEGTELNTVLGGYNYLKIDLFDDEKINISSSIQNVQDISKVYTDFSQSFTVPASENNNKIFEYFYQNDVDGAIDHNLRRYAYIEIGMVPFRSGKIQLEGSSVKNNKVEHYSITFYGDLISLKDTFGNTKINQLNYDFITQPQNSLDVKDRITDTSTDYDVRYPLISSEKPWTYADGTSTDITTSAGRISHTDLFPAVKVSKIFEAIENDYNLTFQSTFLQTDKFKKLFLFCKNIDNVDEKKYGKALTYNNIVIVNSQYNEPPNPIIYDNGLITLTGSDIGINTGYNVYFNLDYISVLDVNIDIDLYKNNVFLQTAKFSADITTNIQIFYIESTSTYTEELTFKIKASKTCDIKYNIQVEKYYKNNYFVNLGGVIAYQTNNFTINNSVTSIYTNMPDITVSDFFSGILKEFNLTCYSVGIDTFQIEPLDNWYSKGAVINVTKYVDTDTISIDRLPLYKNVSFTYQKSESFINRKFAASGKEYGDISNNYAYDGGEYNITVPFENLNFQKFSNTELQVGYCLTPEPDFKPYIPKPILLYYNGATTSSVKFYDGTSESTITNIALFGQDLFYNNQIYSLNFSTDTSTWYNTLIENSLFAVYYFGYLSNLFNIKNRLTKIKANFPIGLITSLRLNDRLVIEDKRYIINTINSDITTGEVSLELINDFRPVITQ